MAYGINVFEKAPAGEFYCEMAIRASVCNDDKGRLISVQAQAQLLQCDDRGKELCSSRYYSTKLIPQ